MDDTLPTMSTLPIVPVEAELPRDQDASGNHREEPTSYASSTLSRTTAEPMHLDVSLDLNDNRDADVLESAAEPMHKAARRLPSNTEIDPRENFWDVTLSASHVLPTIPVEQVSFGILDDERDQFV